MAEACAVAGAVLVFWGLVGALAFLFDVRESCTESRLSRYAALARLPRQEEVNRG